MPCLVLNSWPINRKYPHEDKYHCPSWSQQIVIEQILVVTSWDISASWAIPCVCNCLVQRITHHGKEDFPAFPPGKGVLVPQENRSRVFQPSFQTGEVRKGVKEPFGEQRNTELKPEQVKQAEPRALELRGSTKLRLGKPQAR